MHTLQYMFTMHSPAPGEYVSEGMKSSCLTCDMGADIPGGDLGRNKVDSPGGMAIVRTSHTTCWAREKKDNVWLPVEKFIENFKMVRAGH